jgi:hypothetical protein
MKMILLLNPFATQPINIRITIMRKIAMSLFVELRVKEDNGWNLFRMGGESTTRFSSTVDKMSVTMRIWETWVL